MATRLCRDDSLVTQFYGGKKKYRDIVDQHSVQWLGLMGMAGKTRYMLAGNPIIGKLTVMGESFRYRYRIARSMLLKMCYLICISS